jgi:hypothetical protein
MKEIIESYFNGQYTQMTEQIDAYGSDRFAEKIYTAEQSDQTKLHILVIYLIKKG